MKQKSKVRILISAICAVILLISVLAVTVFANDEVKEDATVKIDAAFKDYRIGSTATIENDGYIGIPLKITTYYDYKTHGAAKPGYNGTPLIVYVVNTNTERIGAKTDVQIITSLLGRGYIVSVLDYMNNEKAKSPDLDWSTQTVKQKIITGAYFTDTTACPKGSYKDTVLLPAGYDVSMNNIFWETDKHGADGDLEKIVENWNTDLRGWFRDSENIVYWRNALGEQKATQKGLDGSDPVWYSDAAGKSPVEATAENANYVQLQHTLALDVTDCVGKDGTPIDLNLYMHVIYPTSTAEAPIEKVPVIALASSSEYLSNGLNTSGRPQFSGFLFNGYAGVVFDYLYQPMAQSDYYGYYDGRTDLGALTGDRMNYGLQLYDDKRINTAAVRYVRYLALTEPDTYSFDTDAIGVYGNSKGGWFTFLGEAELKEKTTVPSGVSLKEAIDARINAYTSKRTYEGHVGETRYQNKITAAYTKNGVTIDGGELQPWLTYTDKNGVEQEILSYASWIYASCGAQYEDITAGHAPVFSALQLRDDFTTTHNSFAEVTACLDIPSMYVIVDYGHTFAYGPDYYHGYDTYQAMFDFAHYYLKDAAVKVVYTDPAASTGRLDTTPSITVKFSGAVTESEIAKITLTSESHTATGTWTSARGKTEWTYKPDALLPDTQYTLTVPANMAGDNGVSMGEAYTASFFTENESAASVTVTKGTLGSYFTVTVPETAGADAKLRFHVANDAANIAELYAVSGFDPASPDSCVRGELVGSVSLAGEGYYEIDVTENVYEKEAGSTVTFLLSAKKTAGITNRVISFNSSISDISLGAYVRGSVGEAPDGSGAAKIYVTTNVRANGNKQYPNEKPFYINTSTAFSTKKLFESNISESDLGRKYRITVRLYDEGSRVVQLSLNRVSGQMVHDMHSVSYNFMTEAGKWQELSFDYTVYEPIYGDFGLTAKNLTALFGATGSDEHSVYISDITVTETVTGIELAPDAALTAGERGGAYKKNAADKAFSVGTVGYDTLAAALSAAKSGDTVVMNKNYTLTDSDNFVGWGAFENITLNLNGYKLYTDSDYPVIHAALSSVAVPETTVNVVGGDIYLSDAALIGYSGSTASANGKIFNVNLDRVNILNTVGSTLTEVISEKSLGADASVTVNVKLEASNIDFTKRINSQNPVTLLSGGSEALSVNYEICGGSIYVDSFAALTFVESLKRTKVTETEGGEYPVILTGEGRKAPAIGVMTENAIASFGVRSTNKGIATYAVEISSLSTKYGIISDAYADAEKYPFVIFDENGNCIGGYSKFLGSNGGEGVMGKAKDYVNNAWNGTSYGTDPKAAYVVLRRNYELQSGEYFNNLAQTQGTVTVDLGGNILSSGTVQTPLFGAFSKGYSGAAGNKIFPTTVIVENGTLRHYRSGIVAMETWDSIGGGAVADKNFNFIFNEVTFGFVTDAAADGLVAHVWTAKETTVAAPYNFVYNDCVYDMRTTKNASGNATVFNTKSDGKYAKITAVVNGGKVITDNPAGLTLLLTGTDNYGSTVLFDKGSDGEYISIVAPEGSSVSIGSYPSVKDGRLGFVYSKTEGTDDIYVLAKNPLHTEYGMITETYKSVDSYPFVVFTNDGTCVGGYATLRAAVSAAKGKNSVNVWDAANQTFGASEVSTVILLRRDYTVTSADTYDDYGQNKGHITIDLNNFALTQGSGTSGTFTNIVSKGWSGKVFPSHYTVKNGKVLVLDRSVHNCWTWQTVSGGAMKEKKFTWDYNNVTFGFAPGATVTTMLVYYSNVQGATTYPPDTVVPFVFNYNDCTFDLKTNAPSGKITLFNAAPGSAQWMKSAITVSGGKIIDSDLTSDKIFVLETVNGSSFKFAKDKDGKYTEIYVTTGGGVPTTVMPTEETGVFKFSETRIDGANTVYTLINTVTEYGTIPDTYLSVLDYPFIVFDSNQKCYKGFAQLMGAQSGAIGHAIYTVLNPSNTYNPETGKYNADALTAYILMRRDYTILTSPKTDAFTNEEYHDNLSHAQGRIVIDLGGFTMTHDSRSTRPIFDATAKGWSSSDDGNKVFPSDYTIKNGEIKLSSHPVLRLYCNDSLGGNAISGKRLSWQFDDVTFSLSKGAVTTSIVTLIDDAKTTTGVAPMPLVFNDCTFDFESVAPTVKTTVFNFNFTNGKYIYCDAVVNGGKLYAGSLANLDLISIGASHGSTVVFGKGSDREMFTVYLSSGADYPDYNEIFPISGGEATLALKERNDGKDVYTLVASEKTDYGYIPTKFASAEDYPFAVFKDGSFVIATKLFGKDASESALHKSKSAGSVVLLRRDFTYSEERYSNLSQTYSVTIDLGGHVFTSTVDREIFYAQKKTEHDTAVKVINGTIVTKNGPVVRFSSWAKSGAYAGGDNFDITFENVTFKVAEGGTPEVLIAVASRDLPECLAYCSVTLNGCVIDITGVESTTLFDLADASGIIQAAASVNGGKIIADDLNGVTVANLADKNSFLFGKDKSGDYTKLYLPEGSVAPADKFNTDEGVKRFVRTGTEGSFVVFGFADASVAEFVVKSSVSLYSDFVFNVYVPARENISSVIFDGKEIDLSTLVPTDVEGASYYKLTKEIPSVAAAESFTLKVTLTLSDGSTPSATWTFSVPEYAKLVLADKDTTETEKTLMKNMLSYVLSAYEYFKLENASEVRAKINAIIGESYTGQALPEDMTVYSALDGVSVASMELGAKPGFVFYPDTDENGELKYSYESYVFTQGTRTLKSELLTDGDGKKYIKVYNYAYGMCDTVDYTITGTQICGSYNIKSYYEFAKAKNDSSLVSLVEWIWRYSLSAKAYRTEVTGK